LARLLLLQMLRLLLLRLLLSLLLLVAAATAAPWAPEAEKELRKIPFFVRGKARRNTERYAMERSITLITVEALYDAKAHFGS
jgi:hypothetical protein